MTLYLNTEHYHDPTAGNAIKNTMRRKEMIIVPITKRQSFRPPKGLDYKLAWTNPNTDRNTRRHRP